MSVGVFGATSEVVDSNPNVGDYGSIVVDQNNNPHISYYDAYNDDLKYATNVSGSWQTYTIDSTGNVGFYTSIAIDSNDNVHISYKDQGYSELKYATNKSGSWQSYVLNPVVNGGDYTSIAIDSADNIYISYLGYQYGDLEFAKSTDGGDTWNFTKIDEVGTVGYYTDITVDNNDNIYISYCNSGSYDLKFAHSSDGGDTWNYTTIDSAGTTGLYTSIDSGSNGNIYISYEGDNNNLNFAKSTDGGSSWSTSVVNSTISTYGKTSIVVDSSDNLYISYLDSAAQNLMLATSNDVGSSWTSDVLNETGNVWTAYPMDVDSNDNLHISYPYRGVEGNISLKYIFYTLPSPPFCGDSNIDAGETCDDGNNVSGDGCNYICQTEPSASSFGGTDFSAESNLSSVSSMTLTKDTSSIDWSTPSDVVGLDLDSNIAMGAGFVSINANSVPALNKSASVSLTVDGCTNPQVYYNPSHQTSFTPGSNGWNLINCASDPSCDMETCVGTTMTLAVTHFDGWGGTGEGDSPGVPEFNLVGIILILAVAGIGLYLISKKN